MANVLVVDDDIAMLDLIKNILGKNDHYVKTISNSDDVLKEKLHFYQLIILDIMMPNINGFELCSIIRDKVDCPILFLTAKSGEADIVKGLGIGADDFLTKPFGIQELRARVNAHLRRESREKINSFYAGNIRFSLASHECYILEKKIQLTKSEYDICEYLALHHGQTFSKEQIYEAVFDFDRESNLSAIVEHIKNIRAKLSTYGEEPIKTVWGVGYRWE